jgi:hypothetical protein
VLILDHPPSWAAEFFLTSWFPDSFMICENGFDFAHHGVCGESAAGKNGAAVSDWRLQFSFFLSS